MSRLELEFTPHDERLPFQTEIRYDSIPPVEVATRTVNIMNGYFGGKYILDPGIELGYLSNQTIDFLYAARKGFLGNFQWIRNIGKMNPEHLDSLLRMNKPFSEEGPESEDTEAFARVYIAMGMLPDVATHGNLPKGFSRRGVFEPPFTIPEVFGRFKELEIQVRRLTGKRVDPDTNPFNHPPLFRTYHTFKAIAEMPERNLAEDNKDRLAAKFADPNNR